MTSTIDETARVILDFLDVAVVIQSSDHRIVYANAKAASLLGISSHEMIERTIDDARWDVISPDGSKVEDDGHPAVRAMRTGRPVTGTILGVRRGDAAERTWIVASAIPELGDNGEVSRVFVTFSDISASQRTVRAHETIYQTVFRSMAGGLVVHEPDGSIRAANAGAERVLGLSIEQMTGRAATDPRWRLMKPDGSPVEADYIPSEIASRTGQSVPERIIGVHRPSGEVAWLEVRADPLRDPAEDGLRGVVATFKDVTEEHKAKTELETSRAQLQRVLDAVPVVVYQFLRPSNGVGRIVFVGGRIKQVLGLDLADVRDRPEIIFDALSDSSRATLLAQFATGDAFECEAEGNPALQDNRRLRIRGVPEVIDDDLLYTGLVSDVTQAHRLEEALLHKHRREAMGEISAGIAHNFNNMLSVILANTHLAREAIGEADRPLLDDVERAAMNASDLVRRMLALGRPSPHNELEVAELVSAIRAALHICRQTFDRAIVIEDHVEVASAYVRGDASVFEQVVLNLCINARDALARSEQRRLTVTLVQDGEHAVRLTVRDTGCGMSPETLRRIGEPFFTTKEPGRGTGLGLATSFQTISEAGGTWHVESTPGRGTGFDIRLPIVARPTPAHARPEERGAAPTAGVILVVDDEPMVRKVLVRQLVRAGYETLAADSGAEALRILARSPIAGLRAILLDLSMPEMPGAQALPLLRAAAPGVPIVVLSGHVDERTPLVGAAAVLQKPIPYQQLVDVLQRACAEHEPPDPRGIG